MWVKDKVVNLIKRYKTTNPFELAARKNIHIIWWDLHEEINGYYKYDRRNRYIVINQNLNFELKLFVCSHELGHAILHTRINTPFMHRNTLMSVDKIEVEANKFAVELLMPDNLIKEYSHLSIYDVARIANVPQEVVHLKSCEYS